MGKIKQSDYLFLSTRVSSLENSLLNRERMERMLEARNDQDAVDVLAECGYPAFTEISVQALDEAVAQQRRNMMEDLSGAIPDKPVVDVFKVRYDYHNVKVLLKAEAMDADPQRMLMDTGRIPVRVLEEAVRSGELRALPFILQEAIANAREVLGTTKDPQLADFALDRHYYEEMAQMSREAGSDFLSGYVRASIDAANLRSVVRTLRMGKGDEFLKGVLFQDGNIDPARILAAVSGGGSLEELYATSGLKAAAEEAAGVLSGGPLTRFEKLTDDALTEYLSKAKYIAIGEAPVIAYIAAKENEFTAVRIIMAGRMAGLQTDTIRERLREAYV